MSMKRIAGLLIQLYDALYNGIGRKNTVREFFKSQTVELSILESFRSSDVLFEIPTVEEYFCP